MSMAGNNVFTTNFTRSNRLTVHWVLQALAGILIFIASICMYLNKIDRQAQHFTTWHGTIGLVTIILTLASIFGGVFTKYSFQLRETVTPIVSKLIHSFMGIATYLLGIVTIILGMYSDWFSYVSSASIQATLLCLAILTSIYVISKSAVTFFARVKTFMTKT